MWKGARDWLKAGGAIDPKDNVLYADLTSIWTVPRLDGKIQLEAKKDMKRRKLPSPGRGDALALSFAFPVQRKARGLEGELLAASRRRDRPGHNPYAPGTLNPGSRGHNPYARNNSR